MMKLAIVAALLAIVTPSMSQRVITKPPPVGPIRECVYIAYDPNVYSIKKSYQVCSYSSPSWVSAFSHPRLSIDTTFSEFERDKQDPTVIKSFKLVFKRSLSRRLLFLNNYATYQEYTGRNTDLGFSGVFDSGLSYIPGWLKIQYADQNLLKISDESTGSVITITRHEDASRGQKWFNLNLCSQRVFLAEGTGVLVDGCSNNVVYPWVPNFASNPNLGRRKRQTEECQKVAQAYAERLPNLPGYSYENVLATCESSIKLVKNTVEIMLNELESLVQSNELFNKIYPDGYTYNAERAEEILAKEEQNIQEQLDKAAKEQ